MTPTLTTEQMNEAIALFEGYRVYNEGNTRCVVNNEGLGYPVKDLRYHESWSWLMPVAKKILDMNAGMNTYQLYLSDALGTADIKYIYRAVCDFVEWHDNNKKPG